MAVGGRFGNSPGGRLRPGTPGTMPDVPPTPVTLVDPVAHLEWRDPRLTGNTMATDFGTAKVATLAAPPQGQAFVIERITIAGAGATKVYVCVGDRRPADVVDYVEPGGSEFVVTSDPSPIHVPATKALHIIWISSTGTCSAAVQVRVEGD